MQPEAVQINQTHQWVWSALVMFCTDEAESSPSRVPKYDCSRGSSIWSGRTGCTILVGWGVSVYFSKKTKSVAGWYPVCCCWLTAGRTPCGAPCTARSVSSVIWTGTSVTGTHTSAETLCSTVLGVLWYALGVSLGGRDSGSLPGGAAGKFCWSSNRALCTWSIWYLSLSLRLKVALQCGQPNGRTSEWMTMCLVKVFLMRKVWLQITQRWGFSPEEPQILMDQYASDRVLDLHLMYFTWMRSEMWHEVGLAPELFLAHLTLMHYCFVPVNLQQMVMNHTVLITLKMHITQMSFHSHSEILNVHLLQIFSPKWILL